MRKRILSFISAVVVSGALTVGIIPNVHASGNAWAVLSAGNGTFHVIKADGTLWAWGDNTYGQIGDGTTRRWVAEPVKVMDNVASVAAEAGHTLAVKTDGTLWAWGDNSAGQIGNGIRSWESVYEPAKVMDGVAAAAVGQGHSLAIKTDGTLWAWGDSYDIWGTIENKLKPTKVMADVTSVATGNAHTLALKNDGTLLGWGLNYNGDLGYGKTRGEPVKVMDGVASISACENYDLALKTDGTLWALGSTFVNIYTGEAPARTPQKLMDGVAFAEAGYSHSLAIRTDGTLWAWGVLYYDDEDAPNYETKPIQIAENVAMASAATHFYTFAVHSDGALWRYVIKRDRMTGGTYKVVTEAEKVLDGVMPERLANPEGTAQVGAGSLKLRLAPNSKTGFVRTLKNAVKVFYYERSGAWVRVKTSFGQEGWVAASYLCTSPYAMKPGDTAKVFSGTLKLRKDARSSSAALKTLKSGTGVKIVDNTSNKTWVKVDIGGTTGWVAASYIGKGI